jgi:hypothetical protein
VLLLLQKLLPVEDRRQPAPGLDLQSCLLHISGGGRRAFCDVERLLGPDVSRSECGMPPPR